MFYINGYDNSQMNGIVDDIIDVAKKAYGAAEPIVDVQLEKIKQQIRDEAGAGAQQAVAPYVYSALGVGALSLIMSITALVIAKKARRGA